MLINPDEQKCPSWFLVGEPDLRFMPDRFEGLMREIGAVLFFVGEYVI